MLTRNVQMNIRVTPEEKRLFEQAAARCGLTLSQYIRMRLHNQIPRQLPNADYRQVLDLMSRGHYDPTGWVEHIPLDAVVDEGFEALHAGTKMKVLVDP